MSEVTYEQLAKERDMAEAYLAITQELGPSEQLFRFVNFDGKLGEELEIGLESFDLELKHDLLVQSLDLDAMDAAATEALVDNVRTLAKGLSAASRTTQNAYLYGGHPTLGLIGNIGQLASKAVLSATNHMVEHVEPYDEVAHVYNDTLDLFQLEEHIADHIPTEFTLKDWQDFNHLVNPAIKKYNGSWFSWGLVVPKDTLGSSPVEWSDSGWTEAKYKDIRKKVDHLEKDVEKTAGHYVKILEAVESYLKNVNRVKEDRAKARRVAAEINRLVVSTRSMFYRTNNRISWLNFRLDEIKTHYEK